MSESRPTLNHWGPKCRTFKTNGHFWQSLLREPGNHSKSAARLSYLHHSDIEKLQGNSNGAPSLCDFCQQLRQ